MKSLFLVFGVAFAIFLATSCGDDPQPNPPGPGPSPSPTPEVKTFEVVGKDILVKGEMKKGAKVTAAEMKAAVSVAVKQLEN